jgi:hypothetical protein
MRYLSGEVMSDRDIFLHASDRALTEAELVINGALADLQRKIPIALRESRLQHAMRNVYLIDSPPVDDGEVERALLDYVSLLTEQHKLIESIKNRTRPVYGWLEEAGREPWDGPQDGLKNLRSRIELIERTIGSCPPPTSDVAFQFLMRSSTGTDQLVIGRILDALKTNGPLRTDAILAHIGSRSETTAKTLLSRMSKIGVITNGPEGYFLVQEVRTSDLEK